ncbi:MAG TPA: nuclear transport factor 2 family protein [Pyrinomonadaceae bacterium]|nr:nuclear transport factor 2 family protein [Pyrinomonadaceae bacterium]
MKYPICLFVLIGMATLFFASKATAQDREAELVRIPLNNYLQGHATGNAEFMHKAFHKDARIMAFREGKLLNLGVEEFASRFTGVAAKDEAQRKRKIESVDVRAMPRLPRSR